MRRIETAHTQVVWPRSAGACVLRNILQEYQERAYHVF